MLRTPHSFCGTPVMSHQMMVFPEIILVQRFRAVVGERPLHQCNRHYITSMDTVCLNANERPKCASQSFVP